MGKGDQIELGTGTPPVDHEPEPATDSSMGQILSLAIREKVSVEVLERLVALQEHVQAKQAEMAMARALAAFQAECPPIPRTKSVDYTRGGGTKPTFKFAPLETMVPIIRPHLTRNGLSFVHDTKVTGINPHQEITVVCVLQHVEGAMRSATFAGPIDSSGGKNPIQMVASARSYGRRYTLMDVLGLTTEDDDDGNGGQPVAEPISDDQFNDLMAVADELKVDKAGFCKFLGVESIRDIPASRFMEARNALEQKRKPKK